MAIILSPNKSYTGTSAGVDFVDGKAETDNTHLLDWFRAHGYAVEHSVTESDENEEIEKLKSMDDTQLLAYAAEKNIDLGNASTQPGYLKKITEALKAGQA